MGQGIEPRHIRRQTGRLDYGWSRGAAWWDYCAPNVAGGPDPTGWGHFLTAYIYELAGGRFLALSLGCHWSADGKERLWSPTYSEVGSLDAAMDYCESIMLKNGLFAGWSQNF